MCVEFRKRMDPELPFYFFTSSQHRFYESAMPDFSKKPEKAKKPKRAPRRELIGSVGRRVSLPVRGSLSVRATFHYVPIDLPPLPDASMPAQITSEHVYASAGPTKH